MADEKQYLSRIRLMDGTTVDIKDQEARLELDSIFARLEALEKIINNSPLVDDFDGFGTLDAGSVLETSSSDINIIDPGVIIKI